MNDASVPTGGLREFGSRPKHDERLISLMEQAVTGKLPVYFAAVPLCRIVPFDPDYRPDLHPAGAAAIASVSEDWRQGRFRNLWVYQRGAWFVVSDDYIPLFAALGGRPEHVPCWVLGVPDSGLAKDVQGPISQADVRRMLGVE